MAQGATKRVTEKLKEMPSREAEASAPKSLSDSALDPVKPSAIAAQTRRLSEQAAQKPKTLAKAKETAAADSAQKLQEAKAPRKTPKVPSPDAAEKPERTQRTQHAKATSAASDEHAGERAAGSEAPERSAASRSEAGGAPARAVRTVVYGSADDPFLAAVMKSVEDALRYPRRARARGWSGTATLQVSVAADGTVGPIEVIESSGRALLDEAAVAAVERSRRTWPKPSHALRLQFPVRFALTP